MTFYCALYLSIHTFNIMFVPSRENVRRVCGLNLMDFVTDSSGQNEHMSKLFENVKFSKGILGIMRPELEKMQESIFDSVMSRVDGALDEKIDSVVDRKLENLNVNTSGSPVGSMPFTGVSDEENKMMEEAGEYLVGFLNNTFGTPDKFVSNIRHTIDFFSPVFHPSVIKMDLESYIDSRVRAVQVHDVLKDDTNLHIREKVEQHIDELSAGEYNKRLSELEKELNETKEKLAQVEAISKVAYIRSDAASDSVGVLSGVAVLILLFGGVRAATMS